MSRTRIDQRLAALEQRHGATPSWRVAYLRPGMTDTEAAAAKAAALRDAPAATRLIVVRFVKSGSVAA